MLSKPLHGWTDITVGSSVGRGSYIQDLPTLLMEALARVLAYGISSAVEIDEEGSVFKLIFAPDTVSFVREGKPAVFAIPARQLARELLADLRRDWEDWLTWPTECSPSLLTPREIKDFCASRAIHLTRLMHFIEKHL